MTKLSTEGLSPDEEQRFQQKKEERTRLILEAPLEDLFNIEQPARPAPRKARIHASLDCEECGERVMESRVRRFGGKNLCIPCFELHEKKW